MNIVVLAGGISTEREVSIVSGTGVCQALRKKGHRAILVDVFCGDARVASECIEDCFPKEYDVASAADYMRSMSEEIEEIKKSGREFFGPNVLKLCKLADIVFLALHGADGEGGTVQAAFDLLRIPYTGSGHLGSAMASVSGIRRTDCIRNRIEKRKSASCGSGKWCRTSVYCEAVLRRFKCRSDDCSYRRGVSGSTFGCL